MGNDRRAEKVANAKESLARVREKIIAIESGAQEYGVGTRRARHADLATLYAREKYLEDLIDGLTGGSGRIRYAVPRY